MAVEAVPRSGRVFMAVVGVAAVGAVAYLFVLRDADEPAPTPVSS